MRFLKKILKEVEFEEILPTSSAVNASGSRIESLLSSWLSGESNMYSTWVDSVEESHYMIIKY